MGLLGQFCGEGGVDGCAPAGARAEPVSAPMNRTRSQQPMHVFASLNLHNL
jgi:hypothetical protein